LASAITTAAHAEELVYDVTFNDAVLAAGTQGFAPGDRIILNDVLLTDGSKTGSTAGVCTVTDPAGVMHCAITFVLPEGSISTQFANTPPPEKHFGLFAGTGAYDGRTGSGVMLEHGDGTGKLTLTIED
jgi:hypothetical protein